MADLPAETIRRAAALMTERADKAIAEGWVQPTSIDWDHVHARGPIVGAGVQPYDGSDPEAWTPTKYVGDLEEVSFAEHIASWHPLAAKAVAGLLYAVADDMDFDGVTLAYTQGGEPELLSGQTGYALSDWTRTYELALVFLGEASDG